MILFLSTLFFTHCNLPDHYFEKKPDCVNASMVTNWGAPINADYQSKVRDILQTTSPQDFRYFFVTFIDEGPSSYMMTNFRNEQYCFEAKLLVNDWNKLAGMKRVNGKAYPKELFDLKWKLQTIGGKSEILYVDMHDIID